LKPTFHQNNTPTIPGATPAVVEVDKQLLRGHPKVVDADLAESRHRR
jgi:hypothetical protein